MTFPPSFNNGYISFPITVDPNVLIQQAFADIQAQFPGWVPNEGQLDVAIIEEAAQMMSVTASVATQVPISIFMFYGQLVGIYPILGTAATAPCLFTMTDTAGYTIPAGTIIAYPQSGNAQILFTLQSTVTIAPGNSTGTGVLVCETVGEFANGLVSATCQMVTTFAQVSSIATTATSAGGVDADTQTTYINRLATELQLLAPRPILPSDFAAMAQNVTGVYRALAINGLSPGRTVTDGVLNSTTTITSATANFTPTDIGRTVVGTGIPSLATISAYTSSTTVTLSAAATATATGVTLAFGDLTNQQRCVTVCGITDTGAAVSSGVNTTLQSYLQGLREVNFLVNTVSPTTTEIDVTVACDAIHGVNTGTLQTSITSALQAFLNPAVWGGGNSQVPFWDPNSNVVRYLDIANVVRNVPGVLYIPSGGITICLHGGTLAEVDVTLPGDAPLASTGTLSVTVTAT